MGLIVGMDEAGYGPNLGPLVVTATAWEVPGHPDETDLWEAFDGIVSVDPVKDGSRLQIGDSKQVYTPSRGIGALEESVLCAMQLAGLPCGTFLELCNSIALHSPHADETEPWFAKQNLELPHRSQQERISPLLTAWQRRCEERGIRLRGICCDIVLTRRFNELSGRAGKGRALTETSMHVLRKVWSDDNDAATLILADKHGGRNFYREFLPLAFGDWFFTTGEEGMDCSRYCVREAEIRFETKAERYFPVAMSSMISKYVRELSMILFNRFWAGHVDGLKPTAGYPVDAKRFRAEIANKQQELCIPDEMLWRAT